MRLARNADDLGLIDGTLAFIEAELGRVESAEQRCLDALERTGLGADVRAQLVGQLGYVRLLNGRTEEAIDFFSDALEHLEGAYRDRVLNNRGIALLTIGELALAAADFTDGLDGLDRIEIAKCAHNLGYVNLLRGELVEALRLMDGARPVLDSLGPFVTASIDIDRAEALEAAALPREASGLLRRVRERLADTDLWRLQADVEVRLARLLGDIDAIALAESAAARCAAHGNDVDADQARAVALGLRAALGAAPQPETFDEVAHRLKTSGRLEAARALRVRAARVRSEMPEPVDTTAPLSTRLLAGEIGAEVALSRGDIRDALRRSTRAADELETWQRSIGSLELQNSTLALGGQVILLGQQSALASGDPAVLLEWSERAREVAARGVPSRPPEELGDLLAQLRHLGPEGDPKKRADLIEQIRHGRWHAGGSITPDRALTLDRLQGALSDARFVSIMCIDDQVIALAIEAESVRIHRLGPWERLETQLGGLAADLALAAQSTSPLIRRSLAERLSSIDAVLRAAFEGAAHVVLTVPDELARVPWGQLESLRGVAVALPLSATAWVRASEDTLQKPSSVAVVIGPETDTGKPEADAVVRAWATRVQASAHPDASCNEVRELAAKVDVLHISAHGRDREGHRLFAATELSDGPWYGHDIELLPAVPDTVVLSACGVGGGSLGMARAWLHAGARHVIAAPADISEAAAAERFPRMHALLADGVSPERAVADAFGPDALDCAVQCYGPSPTAQEAP